VFDLCLHLKIWTSASGAATNVGLAGKPEMRSAALCDEETPIFGSKGGELS
jgi:hypothetical protein